MPKTAEEEAAEKAADRNALAAIVAEVSAVKAQSSATGVDWTSLDALLSKLDADGVLMPRPEPDAEPE